MGGKALVMFSPPPPPAPPPKKALPVEHAVSSGKLLRESVIEVVKSSQEFNIAAPCLWRNLFSTPTRFIS